MNKWTILLLFLSTNLIGPRLLAQTTEKALAMINYNFIHVNDTNNRDIPKQEEVIVYLGQYSSSYKNLRVAKWLESQIESSKKRQADPSGPKVTYPGSQGLILLANEKQFLNHENLGASDYLIDLGFPVITWEIGEETKEILGYNCQQAFGEFGGRSYTAWFASELPFAFGPWKLHGLPGLILEAEDSKKEVAFKFLGFEKIEDKEIPILPEMKLIKIDEKTFAKMKTALEDDPGLDSPSGEMIYYDNKGRISKEEYKAQVEQFRAEFKAKNNNPIEL